MGLSRKMLTIIPRRQTLTTTIQLRFLKRLSRLLDNGYPLIEALDIIQWDLNLSPISQQMITLLKNGFPIDQAFEQAKFHPDITSYLFFVRTNGDLASSIQKCTTIYEQRINYLAKFKQTMRYPIILLSIFIILLIFLRHTILPSFLDIFQMSDESSSTIVLSILIIEWIIRFLLLTFIFSIIGTLVWKRFDKKIGIQTKIKIYNIIPFFRHYMKLQTSLLFATHMGTLLKTGMPINEILTMLEQQKKLPILSFYAKQMTLKLSQGIYITHLLTQLTFIDPQLSVIFQKNVDNQSLERDLTTYADYLTEEMNRKMMKLLAMIQPVIFVILASFIIFIYVTLMWPMFQLIKTI